VGGRYEIDVVAAAVLQIQEHGRQLLCRNRSAFAIPTKLVILAKHAAEVAVREENCARTTGSAEAPFFTKVRPIAADARISASPAH